MIQMQECQIQKISQDLSCLSVIQDFLQHLCDPFEIPKDWKYYLAHDPKLSGV